MSDSELSDALSYKTPPDSEIESTLKNEVRTAAIGPLEEYTVSRIRKAAEKSLGLPEDFFKGDDKWKSRSKTVIEKQVEVENERQAEPVPTSNTTQQKPPTKTPKKSVKRSSPNESQQPRKKQKVDSNEETSALSSPPEDSEDDYDEIKSTRKVAKDKKKPTPAKTKAKAEPKTRPRKGSTNKKSSVKDDSDDGEEVGDKSDSDMSVVLDEAPAKKGRSKSINTTDEKSKAAKAKPKGNGEADPDQEEIKKLQGWLAKCGIRKVWGKELKPFGTSKAKMKYLRDMLAEAGMTGRYSNEKAAQIKEARELAADIEAVQEGNERWGKSEDEEDDDGDGKTRGGRRLVRGAKNYDFLSSDGEETD